MRRFIFLIIIGTCLNVTSYAQESIAPDIRDVQKAALDYARIRPDELSELKRRSRRSAILPRIQLGARRNIQNDIDIAINDNVSVTSNGTTIGPETTDLQQSADNDTALEVKAVWSLNELIYNRDMLDVAEEARYQIRERRMILSEVNRLYFEWLKLRGDNKTAIGIQIAEVVADLDALTDGWFSNHL